ncbi:hypothetical protein ACLJK8_23035, partial [Amaricoccus sp. W119]
PDPPNSFHRRHPPPLRQLRSQASTDDPVGGPRLGADHRVRWAPIARRNTLAGLLDKANTASAVWADTAYRSQKHEKRIAGAGLVSKIHFRRAPGKALTANRQRANAARSKIRSAVEHPFAEQKGRMGLCVRTIGIARAKVKIGLANIAFDMKRLVFLERSEAAA